MMQLAKKVPFDNPDILLLVRGLYIASNVIIISIYLYTQSQINKKKGMLISTVYGPVQSTNWPRYDHS